jgi:hypothetical protein
VWPEIDEKKVEGGEHPDSDGDDEKEEPAPSKTKDLKQVWYLDGGSKVVLSIPLSHCLTPDRPI